MKNKFIFQNDNTLGKFAHDLARELWPINRSLTGEGNRETLDVLKKNIPNLQLKSVKSGENFFDWTVPKEWNTKSAWIKTPSGKKICDFSINNLHLVGYSVSIDLKLSLAELQNFLHSLPDQPSAIPYITSYYNEKWGFCISQEERDTLIDGEYHVYIDSELKDGQLDYADVVYEGASKKEIVFSTYFCHPSMANNELSGPVVASAIANIIHNCKDRRYSYRFIFVPETIGAIIYIDKNLKYLQSNVIAGFVLTCVGDEGCFSYMPSPSGNTYADKLALAVLDSNSMDYKKYSFLERGSDERQYCSPNVNLPFCSVMKSKYAEFPEYHTSLDDLNFVTAKGLGESIEFYRQLVELAEKNKFLKATQFCEPQLGKRGLYSLTSKVGSSNSARPTINLLAYANGDMDLIDLSKKINLNLQETINLAEILETHFLLEDLD